LKKIILFLLIISSLYATSSESKPYVGVSIGYLNENFSESGYDSFSTQVATLKIGYGLINSYAVEFLFDYIPQNENIFSASDKDRYGINLAIMKAFDFDTFAYPFFKAGFGAGYLDISDTNNNSLSYSSYNLGFGCFIPFKEHLDIEVGYRYRFTSYEKISESSKSTNSHINIGYVGINMRF